MECTHYFNGAGAKRRAFRGWAGRVAGWPEKGPPKIEFGTWHPDHANLWNGGAVIFDCQPFDLVMFGANSAAMDPRDKTTQFGFAGLGTEGKLRIATLPKNTDVRKIFAAGGWVPPNSDLLVGDLQQCMQDSSITSARIKELITLLSAEVCAGFGIHSAHLEEVLSIWPILSSIHSILATATNLAANKQKEAAIKKRVSGFSSG